MTCDEGFHAHNATGSMKHEALLVSLKSQEEDEQMPVDCLVLE